MPEVLRLASDSGELRSRVRSPVESLLDALRPGSISLCAEGRDPRWFERESVSVSVSVCVCARVCVFWYRYR